MCRDLNPIELQNKISSQSIFSTHASLPFYSADFTFNDLTNSKARLGLFLPVLRGLATIRELIPAPITRGNGQFLVDKFPTLCENEMAPLCLS
jgi:hypothetical protein